MSGGIEMLGELREPGGPNALSLAGGQVATRFTLCRGARNSVTSHPTHTHLGTPWGHRKGPWLQPSVWRRQLKFPRWAGSGWDEGKDAEFIVNIAERALYIPSNEQHGQIFKAYCWMKKVRNRSFIAQQNVLTTETTLEKKNKSCVFQSQIVTGRPWHSLFWFLFVLF